MVAATIAPRLPGSRQHEGQQRAADDEFECAQSEHKLAQRPKPVERQLQPDREQQQHDPQFGKYAEAFWVADRDVSEPRVLEYEAPEAIRSDQQPHENEANDRRDPDPREQRNDETCRAKNDESVGKDWGSQFTCGHVKHLW